LERTGASGYLGGEVLHQITTSRPHVKISCLNRDAAKASKIIEAYPKVRIVEGDLDRVDVLEQEAKDADIVFRMLPAFLPLLPGFD